MGYIDIISIEKCEKSTPICLKRVVYNKDQKNIGPELDFPSSCLWNAA